MALVKLPCPYEIEPELRDQLSGLAGLQRCLEGHDEILLIVHDVPRPTQPAGQPVFFWKRHDGRWMQPSGPGIGELSELLERYGRAIDSHYEVVNQAEDAAAVFAVLRHAGPLSRSTRELARVLDQALQADPEDRAMRALRDRARELERLADFLNTDARSTLEFLRTEHGRTQARAAERLVNTANRVAWMVGVIAFCALLGVSALLPDLLRVILWVLMGGGMALAGVFLKRGFGKTREKSGELAVPDPRSEARSGE